MAFSWDNLLRHSSLLILDNPSNGGDKRQPPSACTLDSNPTPHRQAPQEEQKKNNIVGTPTEKQESSPNSPKQLTGGSAAKKTSLSLSPKSPTEPPFPAPLAGPATSFRNGVSNVSQRTEKQRTRKTQIKMLTLYRRPLSFSTLPYPLPLPELRKQRAYNTNGANIGFEHTRHTDQIRRLPFRGGAREPASRQVLHHHPPRERNMDELPLK